LEFESRWSEEFSLLHIIKTQSPAPWVLEVKQQGLEADHSPATNSEEKKTWVYSST
jgi:hypothetical protein